MANPDRPAAPAYEPTGPDLAFLKNVTKPNSVASIGERMACITQALQIRLVPARGTIVANGTPSAVGFITARRRRTARRRACLSSRAAQG
jgi:hypothetical protein